MDFSAGHQQRCAFSSLFLVFDQYLSSCHIKLVEMVSGWNGFVKYNQMFFLASLRMHLKYLLPVLQKLFLLSPQLFS